MKVHVIEFSGILEDIPNTPPNEHEIDQLMADLTRRMDETELHTEAEIGLHDTVASTCIMSQFTLISTYIRRPAHLVG